MDRAPRLAWPDQAKGFGILLVVIGHVWRGLQGAGLLPDGALFQAVDRLIYVFHMPLFFFLSGLFFAAVLRRSPGDFLLSRLVHILWPLILWTWIFFAFKALAGSLANTPADWSVFPLFPLPPREQFWFFWALFLIQGLTYLVLHPLARTGTPGPGLLAFVTALAFGLMFLPFGPLFPVEWFGAACRHAGPFALGLCLAPWLVGPAPLLSPRLALGLFLACETLALALPATPLTDLFLAIGAVLAVTLFLRAAPRLPGRPLLSWLATLGRASAAIYVAHVLFAAALRIVLVQAGFLSLPLHLVLGTAAGVIGPMLLLAVLKRFRLAGLMGLPG